MATGFPYDRSDEYLDKILNKIKQVLQACRAGTIRIIIIMIIITIITENIV